MADLLNPYSFASGGNTFHVATTGNNANPGTAAAPWATLAYSVSQLRAGDTLVVSGGTYYESINITENGTSTRPITIVAATGETPIIDGSMSAYRTASNSAWELVNGGINLWRTVAVLAYPGDLGYTGRIDVGGQLYMLTSYRGDPGGMGDGIEFLSATTDLYDVVDPYYMGPGITHHADGHVYIRLDPNTAAAHWDVITTPFNIADKDPRNHAIYICPNNGGVNVDGDWVVVDGIHVHHFWNCAGGMGTDVTIRNLTMWPSRFGARTDAARWTFDDVTIEFHLPEWLSRSDVKGWGEPAKDTRTCGVSFENASGGSLLNSTINGAFDATLVLGNNVGVTITNCTMSGTMDDACQLGSAAYDFEFAYNLVTECGISHDGSGSDAANTPDSVYVHHNVFDNTTPVFWARKPVPGVDPAENGTGGYLPGNCIGSHGVPDFDDPWKLYNNTFVSAAGSGVIGVLHYAYHGTAAGDGIHEAYNNLINLKSANTRVYRNARANTGLEAYDHNIYARVVPLGEFAIDSIDETGTPQSNTPDFSTWLSQMGTFDANSIHQTTQVPLNDNYETSLGSEASSGGLDLSSTGWPGTTPGTTYIGAKPAVSFGPGGTITFVAATNTTYATRTTTTVTKPTGTANDDYVLLGIVTGADPDAPDPTPPTGFTLLASTDTTGSPFNVEMRVYGKAASSEPASWDFTHTSCPSQGFGLAYRGVDLVAPLMASNTNVGSGSTSSVGGFTTTEDGAMVIFIEHDFGDDGDNLVPPSGTTPTFTERIEVNPLIYVADGSKATAGPTGSKSMGNNSSVSPWAVILLALRPA